VTRAPKSVKGVRVVSSRITMETRGYVYYECVLADSRIVSVSRKKDDSGRPFLGPKDPK
jgi:hypothetical protein